MKFGPENRTGPRYLAQGSWQPWMRNPNRLMSNLNLYDRIYHIEEIPQVIITKER